MLALLEDFSFFIDNLYAKKDSKILNDNYPTHIDENLH
jgi:hypothetical protein